MSDLGLWIILAAFVAWEIAATFVFRNRRIHSLSWLVWRFERRLGLPGYLLVSAAVVAVFLHLVPQLF